MKRDGMWAMPEISISGVTITNIKKDDQNLHILYAVQDRRGKNNFSIVLPAVVNTSEVFDFDPISHALMGQHVKMDAQ